MNNITFLKNPMILIQRCIAISFICILFANCNSPITKEDLVHLNGYWEIEKVKLTDGTEKQYNFNPSIDYFEVSDTIGVRKKLQPQLDGTFISTRDSENFTLQISEERIELVYNNTLSSWKEQIISVTKDHMIIKNEAQNMYFYRRFKKLSLK